MLTLICHIELPSNDVSILNLHTPKQADIQRWHFNCSRYLKLQRLDAQFCSSTCTTFARLVISSMLKEPLIHRPCSVCNSTSYHGAHSYAPCCIPKESCWGRSPRRSIVGFCRQGICPNQTVQGSAPATASWKQFKRCKLTHTLARTCRYQRSHHFARVLIHMRTRPPTHTYTQARGNGEKKEGTVRLSMSDRLRGAS